MCLHRYSAIDGTRMASKLFSSPRPPPELLRDRQDLFLRAGVQVSDPTQTLFKAVPGAALKKGRSGRVTSQDTLPGFQGSRPLSERSSL